MLNSPTLRLLASINPRNCLNSAFSAILSPLKALDPYPKITFVGAVFATAKLAAAFFSEDGHVRAVDVVIVMASWVGYHCCKKNSFIERLEKENKSIREKLTLTSTQLEAEKKLREEELKKTTQSLAEGVLNLAQPVETYLAANQMHADLLGETKKQVEQAKEELARVEGLIDVAKEELKELEDEVQSSENDKEELKEEVSKLLEQQKTLFADFSKKVQELSEIEAQLRAASGA